MRPVAPVRVRVTKLCGQPAVVLFQARILGEVSGVLVDPATARIDALDALPRWAPPLRIPSQRVRRIGRHAVMLDPGGDEPAVRLDGDDRRIDLEALAGLEVLTDHDDRAGYLADAYVDADSMAVKAYELAAPFWQRWLGSSGLIYPREAIACSRDVMVVPQAATWEMDSSRR